MINERTYSWNDPRVLMEAATIASGIEFLEQICDGRLPAPPAAETTGIVPIEVGDGYAIAEFTPQQWHCNPMGIVHGGIIATLADTALGCAVHTKLPAGMAYTSLDLTVKFTRAVTLDIGPVRADGRIVSLGRRSATAEARITDSSGRVLAHAVATCLLISSAA